MTTSVIELFSFQLKDGASQKPLAHIQDGANAVLRPQVGFMYRSVSTDEKATLCDACYSQGTASSKQAGGHFIPSKNRQAVRAYCWI